MLLYHSIHVSLRLKIKDFWRKAFSQLFPLLPLRRTCLCDDIFAPHPWLEQSNVEYIASSPSLTPHKIVHERNSALTEDLCPHAL